MTIRPLRYPLHLAISVVFSTLLLLFGLVLTLFFYGQTSRISLSDAEQQIRAIGQEVGDAVAALYVPPRRFVSLASLAIEAGDSRGSGRERMIAMLAEALRDTPSLSSVFVANDQGDFAQLRALDRADHADPSAPTWTLLEQRRENGRLVHNRIRLLDADLNEVGQAQASAGGFDPRERDWYRTAMEHADLQITGPYRFYSSRMPGITIARRVRGGGGVVAADLSLAALAAELAEHRITPSTRTAIVTGDGRIIAAPVPFDPVAGNPPDGNDRIDLPELADLGDRVLAAAAQPLLEASGNGQRSMRIRGRHWLVSKTPLPSKSDQPVYLLLAAPTDELLADALSVRDQGFLISAGLILLGLGLTLWFARGIAASLRRLAAEAADIRALRLSAPITAQSMVSEVDDLALTMSEVKSSLGRFLEIARGLSGERDLQRLIALILAAARKVSRADAGAVLLLDEDSRRLEPALVTHGDPEQEPVAVGDSVILVGAGAVAPDDVDRRIAESTRTLSIERIDALGERACAGLLRRFVDAGSRPESLLGTPLRNQKGEVIGVLQLINARAADGRVTAFTAEIASYIEALASNAAVALDVRRLLTAQRALLEGVIELIAQAIDAKSPYTGGHCQRVPEIARMLTEAAEACEDAPFADFALDADGWDQLRIAAWLHDCGKLTTPEFVVDKATKLETIYNRIHEVRMRFEVLWRDAEIEYLQGCTKNPGDEPRLRTARDERHGALQEDFAFVAECNVGGEWMADEKIERLQRIGAATWLRHFDERLGLSRDELLRFGSTPAAETPAMEHLLADRAEHVVARDPSRHPFGDNALGFRMDVPERDYNHGELYNLALRRGTLNPEERFKINDHIVQTLIMLKRLPFPRELSEVPDWAANHHEKIDGTGFPRRLSGADLSIPERIMAVADIFEALTASDRPYKSGKPISEALRIMATMRDQGHICPDVFALLVSSGVYRDYAERYLSPQQNDEPDAAPP